MTRFPCNPVEDLLRLLVDEHGLLCVVYALVETCYYKADEPGCRDIRAWEDVGQWLAATEAAIERSSLYRGKGG